MSQRSARRIGALLAFLSLLVLAPARIAVACTCAQLPPGDPVALAGRHSDFFDHAFIGVIERIADPVETDPQAQGYAPGTYVPYILEVEVRLAGEDDANRVILLQQSRPDPGDLAPDCAYGFAPGRRYLVEAHANPDGTFLTNGCGFTEPYGIGAAESGAAPDEAPGERPAPADADDGPLLLSSVGIAAVLVVIGAAIILTMSLRRRRPRPEPRQEGIPFPQPVGPPPPGTGQEPVGPPPPGTGQEPLGPSDAPGPGPTVPGTEEGDEDPPGGSGEDRPSP